MRYAIKSRLTWLILFLLNPAAIPAHPPLHAAWGADRARPTMLGPRPLALPRQSGPGIELLEYLAPRDGRPFPQGARANDLYHWQTKLVVGDAAQAALVLRERKYRFISSGVITIQASEMEAAKSFLVRDPDGHALQLIEK